VNPERKTGLGTKTRLEQHTSADTRAIANDGASLPSGFSQLGIEHLGVGRCRVKLIATLPFALSRLLSGRVHIGFSASGLVLQSFCRPRRPGKKHAVTVNTVSFDKFLLARSRLVRLLTWAC